MFLERRLFGGHDVSRAAFSWIFSLLSFSGAGSFSHGETAAASSIASLGLKNTVLDVVKNNLIFSKIHHNNSYIS
ncbi:hypothetical protein L1987_43422 [Smallanthus sonchifolius]|uniref:Uncharacterized protein n=1 Tax=Smallanthus sonchifolius TaxID=185202 RepID=A0ACB9GLK9_9ASTR|nr:hypothetical protein L1987_43422 [Smallanthus sonchifolius]